MQMGRLILAMVAAALGLSAALAEGRPAGASLPETELAAKPCGANEPKADCVEKLRAILRSELARGSKPCESDALRRDGCDEVAECLPTSAQIVHQLWELEAAAAPAVPELIGLLGRSDLGLQSLTLVVLARLGERTATLPVAKKLVRVPEWICRRRALSALRAIGPAGMEEVVDLLLAGDDLDQREAAEVLGWWRDGRAVAPLMHALQSAKISVQVPAANALGLIGAADPESVELLQALSSGHWSDELRTAAAAAASRLGAPTAPRRPKCSSLLPLGDDWVGSVEGARAELTHLRKTDRRRCSIGGPGEDSFCLETEAGLVVGRAAGEWGGDVRVIQEGRERVIRDTPRNNPVGAVRSGAALFVFEGLDHKGPRFGNVVRLEGTPSGGWRVAWDVEVGGTPVGYGFDVRGELLVLTKRRVPPRECETDASQLQLLRVREDGSLEEAG